MAFIDRIVEHPGRYILTNATTGVQLGTFDLVRAEGEVTTDGTLLNAANLNEQTQLDVDVVNLYEPLYQEWGTTPSENNDMSNALYLLAKMPQVIKYGSVQGGTGNTWWTYRRWTNGMEEAWGAVSFGSIAGSAWTSGMYYTDQTATFPSGIFSAAPTEVFLTAGTGQWIAVGTSNYTTTGFNLRAMKPTSSAQGLVMRVYAIKYPTS